MARIVKVGGSTRLSSKNQVTIPTAVLAETQLSAGDRLVVTGDGQGRVVLERVDDVVSEYSGALTGRLDSRLLEELNDEWV